MQLLEIYTEFILKNKVDNGEVGTIITGYAFVTEDEYGGSRHLDVMKNLLNNTNILKKAVGKFVSNKSITVFLCCTFIVRDLCLF